MMMKRIEIEVISDDDDDDDDDDHEDYALGA